MNRLIIYRITIAIALFLNIISIFGAFTFTFVELIFFVSSILMVFSFEKTPTEDLDKPQIHQYVTNRLNYYNYFAAGCVVVFITLYVVLKYIDSPRALLYMFASWILCSIALQYVYKYTSLRKFKYALSDYLIMLSTKDTNLSKVTGDQIITFVDIYTQNPLLDDLKLSEFVVSSVKLPLETTTLLIKLSDEYTKFYQEPLKSSELP